MQNNYDKEVFNGDIGRIAAHRRRRPGADRRLRRPAGRLRLQRPRRAALAYAVTIHKSQGSEYPAVVIPLHTQHFVMLQRNLLYTGVTRGRKWSRSSAAARRLAMAVQRADTSRRYSLLRQRLRQLAESPLSPE